MYDDNSLAQLALNQLPGSRGSNGDEKLYVEFKMHPMQDDVASEKAQRPVWKDVEFVQIAIPGDRDVYFQPATEQDKMRFRRQYENFKAGRADATVGTPLALLPGVTPAMVEEFAYFKIRTVEALAGLNDGVAGQMPGAHEWKRKAKAFLMAAEQQAPVAAMQAQLEKRDDQIAALQAQLKELATAVAKGSKDK